MVRSVIIVCFVVILTMTAYGMGHATGYATAHKNAYDTRKVSQGLEMACLSLWVTGLNNDYAGRTE